jgi:hypothetical protein
MQMRLLTYKIKKEVSNLIASMMNYRRKVLSIYKFLFPKKSTNHIETSI